MRIVQRGLVAFLLGIVVVFGMTHAAQAIVVPQEESVTPEMAMVDLTVRLGDYARGRIPNFLLVGNGSTGLLEATEYNSEENVARLVGALDGFFMESRF